jgi:catechol 2,3-dioxygenase-like lactoylglutathione lyase family enzyme
MSQTVSSIKQQKYEAGVARVDMKLEVNIIPVSDVERSKLFYQRLGWRLDSDIAPAESVRIVQFTPPGSACSVTFGKGITAAAPGSAEGGLIVSDIQTAHDDLVGRGIEASEVWHGAPFPPEARLSGREPKHTSYGSFCSFHDPDGNVWMVQEVTVRAPGRIDPARRPLPRQTIWQARCGARQVPTASTRSATGSTTGTGRTGTQLTWRRSRQEQTCRGKRLSACSQ